MRDLEKIVNIKGLQFMPVREDKRPIHDEWQISERKYDFSNAKAIGLVCGKISGNVEVIDIDLKYDITGKLFEQYKTVIKSINPDILKKLVVQKTKSGGYHFIYRCSYIEGNLKLANRPTTQEEKKQTYLNSYEKEYQKQINAGKPEDVAQEEAKKVAENSSKNDKIRVLLETRGDKGYIACYPTPGYELIYGSFDKINVLTPAEREVLFSVAYTFNEIIKEPIHKEIKPRKQIKGLSSIEDYNQRGDVIGLLEKHGWEVVGKKGSKTLVKRPGDTKAEHSGNFDEEKNWFSVFSTSTQFEAQTPYLPYAVFTILECNGDFKLTPKALSDLGYGDTKEEIREHTVSNTIPSVIDTTDDSLSFLATEEDYEDYLNKWRTNTFDMGKSTGLPELDKHFLFKEGNLVIVNGIDNVGKSTVIWYLAMLSSLYNGWDWLIFSSENGVGTVVRKLIEFYWCEPIGTMSELKYKKAKEYVKSKFDIIKVGKELYNYQDILNMTTLAFKKRKYKGLMIDPYNSLKVDIPAKSKQQTYDYHYEAASVLQLYGKQNNLSIYLNCHVGTVGARKKDNQGFTEAPQKEDTEMGVMFANKADDFLTIHRITQHDTEWMITEIHVRKIKETETGGKVTPKHRPFKMRMVQYLVGFEYFNFNPVLNWHFQKNNESVIEIPMDFKNYVPAEHEDEEPPF